MFCGTKTLKISSFILDFLCCIFGALNIIAGAYTLVNFNQSEAIRLPCILGIVLGSLLLLSTVLGCCAALRENIRLTWIYAAVLMALLCAQITVMFVQPVRFDKLANETVNHAWQGQLHKSNEMATYEIKYKCCGKTGPNNYPDSGLKVPATCYVNQTISDTNLYTVGCNQQLANAYREGTRWEVITDWTQIGVEGLTIIVAGMLAIALKNAERRRLYS